MTSISNALWHWLVDYYALSTCVMAAVAAAMFAIRQPARRLVVAWSGLVGLAVLLVFAMLPGWPRTSLVVSHVASLPTGSVFDRSAPARAIAQEAGLSAAPNDPVMARPNVAGRGPSSP